MPARSSPRGTWKSTAGLNEVAQQLAGQAVVLETLAPAREFPVWHRAQAVKRIPLNVVDPAADGLRGVCAPARAGGLHDVAHVYPPPLARRRSARPACYV